MDLDSILGRVSGLKNIAKLAGKKDIRTVRRWINEEGMPAAQDPSGKWFIYIAQFQSWELKRIEKIKKLKKNKNR